jgi:methionyl-tRNA formyltransferase
MTHTPPGSRHPKILLLADSYVGLEITKYLLNTFKNDISAIVTTSKNAVYESANANKIPTFVYDASPTFINQLPDGITLGISAWWPSILKEPLLNFPRFGFINTHPSLLPHNRGKNPNFWSIVEQRPFGVSLHKIDAGFDTGPIVAQRQIEYDWTDNGGTLYRKALLTTIELFKEVYPSTRLGSYSVAAQTTQGSFHYARELDPASEVKLSQTYLARDLLNLLRARTFEPYPPCFFVDDGKTYEVRISISEKKENL